MVQSLHRDELPPRLAMPEGPRLGGSGPVVFRISRTPAPLHESPPDRLVALPALFPEGSRTPCTCGSCVLGV